MVAAVGVEHAPGQLQRINHVRFQPLDNFNPFVEATLVVDSTGPVDVVVKGLLQVLVSTGRQIDTHVCETKDSNAANYVMPYREHRAQESSAILFPGHSMPAHAMSRASIHFYYECSASMP